MLLVAGFDKMRYWSPVRYLGDALHSKGLVNMKMYGEKLMGYIYFASLETNGTFLVAGIVDDAMCTQDPRHCPYIREVEQDVWNVCCIHLCSTQEEQVPHHQHHNRGSTKRFPIAGGEGLLSFEGTNKMKIVDHC
jgi:hypothetical protein